MAYRAFYDDPSEIPADQRAHYTENDAGQWVLQVNGGDGWAVENVAGLKSALAKQKRRADDAEKLLAPWKSLEVTPDEVGQMREELAALKEANTGSKSDNTRIEQLTKQLEEVKRAAQAEREKELAPLRTKLTRRDEQVRTLMVDNALTAAIAAEGGSVDLLHPVMARFVRVQEDNDGSLRVEVVDGEGNPRVTGADLQPMGIPGLVAEMKNNPKYAPAFPAPDASGAATQISRQGGPATVTPTAVGQMSMAEYRKARTEGRIT